MDRPSLSQQKIDQLEKSLVRLWDSLSPELQRNKSVWDKFLNLQTRVRLINLQLKGNLKNETTK